MTSSNSRLSKRLEKQTKRKLWLTVIGIVLMFIFIVKFGVPIIINFSLFIAKINNKPDTTQASNATSFIATPNLDPLFTATNSAQITVSGNASAGQKISLYVNNTLSDEMNSNNDGSFKFANVTLQSGDNTIKVKATQGNKDSDFTNDVTVTYKSSAPKLDIDNLRDGQTFSKDDNPVTVSGKTDPDAKVTVNDLWAINNNGNFSYPLQLQNGDNQIKIIATDAAGNKTEKDMKVTYNQ